MSRRIDWEGEKRKGTAGMAAGAATTAAGAGAAVAGGMKYYRGMDQAAKLVARKPGDRTPTVTYKPDRLRNAVSEIKYRAKNRNSTAVVPRGKSTKQRHYKIASSPEKLAKVPKISGRMMGAGTVGMVGGYGMTTGGFLRRDEASRRIEMKRKRDAKVSKKMTDNQKRRAKTAATVAGISGGSAVVLGREVSRMTKPGAGLGNTLAMRRVPLAVGVGGTALGGIIAGTTIGGPKRYENGKRVVRKAAKYSAPKYKVDEARLRRAKKMSVGTSTASGALGVGALGALVATRAPSLAPRIGMSAARAKRIKDSADKATVPLSAASLGVGGVGSLNFARVQNQEANKLPKLSDLKPRKRVRKSYGADFGLSGVSQGQGNAELIYKRKDWKNISEHQRRAADARRTRRGGSQVAALGGSAVMGAAAMAASRGRSAGVQTKNVAQGLKLAGGQYRSGLRMVRSGHTQTGRAVQSASGRLASQVVRANPYGAAVLGGAGAMATGAGMSTAGYANEKRHNRAIARQRKARVSKAYDNEKKRQNRLDAYSIGLGAGAGAAGVKASSAARDSASHARKYRKHADTARSNSGVVRNRAINLRQLQGKNALKQGGKSAGLAALSGGLLVGADQVQRYKRGKGQSYNTRQW